MVIRKATQNDLVMIDRMIPAVFKESMDTKINLTDETMQSMSRALVHQGAPINTPDFSLERPVRSKSDFFAASC